nr:hypothetical protein [Methylobacterium sp. L1A1]
MIAAAVPRARLDLLALTGSPHLRPVYAAMRDGRRTLLVVPQRSGACSVPGKPFVALVGDDTECALGPEAFHRPSVERFARSARGIALISCGIMPGVYAVAAEMVRLGHSTLIVETRPEREAEWMEALRAAAPKAAFLMCTTAEGTA